MVYVAFMAVHCLTVVQKAIEDLGHLGSAPAQLAVDDDTR
jgi:hypothetical protein